MDALDAYRARPCRETRVALLEAHQDTVYNLCAQVLRHPQDAQDAAQQVLMSLLDALPRLTDAVHLKQWLHRAAYHASLDLKKTAKRRREREARVALMAESKHPPISDEAADAVQVHVAQLDDELRSLVVEHYFDQKPLGELAGERGVSTVAVWKKLERAREQLRETLTRAGYASALPGLDGFFASMKPVAAPKGLLTEAILTKAAAAAVVGGAALKIKTIAAAAVLVLGAAGTVGFAVMKRQEARQRELDQLREASRAKVRAALERAKAAVAAPAAPVRAETIAAVAPAPEVEEPVEVFKSQQEFSDAYRRACRIQEDGARWKALRRLGFVRTDAQFRKAESKLTAKAGTEEFEQEFIGRMMAEWAQTDFKNFVDSMMRIPVETGITGQKKLEQVALAGGTFNREGAMAYARALKEEDGRAEILKALAVFEPPQPAEILAMAPGPERMSRARLLLDDWGRKDPRAAAQWVEQLTDASERTQARALLAMSRARVDLKAAAAWVEESAPPTERRSLVRDLISGAYQQDPKGAIEFAAKMLEEKEFYCPEVEQAFRAWARTDPASAVQYLQKLPPSTIRTGSLPGLGKLWAMRDPSAALEWAEKLPEGDDRTEVLVQMTGGLVKSVISNPKEALSIIDKLPEARRPEAVAGVVDAWAEIDAAAAAVFARSRPGETAKLDEIIARKWARWDVEAAFSWARALPEGPDRDGALVSAALAGASNQKADRAVDVAREIRDAAKRDETLNYVVHQLSGKDLEKAIAVTSEILDPARRKDAQGYIVGNCAAMNPERCVALLNQMADAGRPEYGWLAQTWAMKDGRAATMWAAGVARQDMREWALMNAFPHWARLEPDAARAWVDTASVSDGFRKKLIKQFPQKQ
jgi:RNA polymerase sigma-70 factor (ECF subfamily)